MECSNLPLYAQEVTQTVRKGKTYEGTDRCGWGPQIKLALCSSKPSWGQREECGHSQAGIQGYTICEPHAGHQADRWQGVPRQGRETGYMLVKKEAEEEGIEMPLKTGRIQHSQEGGVA